MHPRECAHLRIVNGLLGYTRDTSDEHIEVGIDRKPDTRIIDAVQCHLMPSIGDLKENSIRLLPKHVSSDIELAIGNDGVFEMQPVRIRQLRRSAFLQEQIHRLDQLTLRRMLHRIEMWGHRTHPLSVCI